MQQQRKCCQEKRHSCGAPEVAAAGAISVSIVTLLARFDVFRLLGYKIWPQGATRMEIFVKIFVWILNHTYRRPKATGVVEQDPMVEAVLREHEEEAEAQRKNQIVANFKSEAAPIRGAVDYADLKWESFSRVAETPAEFTFYIGQNIAKVIAKSEFSGRQEIRALRRVIRRQVAACVLLDD
jgi:hypothetical protein